MLALVSGTLAFTLWNIHKGVLVGAGVGVCGGGGEEGGGRGGGGSGCDGGGGVNTSRRLSTIFQNHQIYPKNVNIGIVAQLWNSPVFSPYVHQHAFQVCLGDGARRVPVVNVEG